MCRVDFFFPSARAGKMVHGLKQSLGPNWYVTSNDQWGRQALIEIAVPTDVDVGSDWAGVVKAAIRANLQPGDNVALTIREERAGVVTA